MMFDLHRLRQQWRDLNRRVEQLERRLKATDGMVDALLSDAEYTPSIDLGMNGQRRRKEVVEQLFENHRFDRALETGTFLGATTGYIATKFGIPVYSSEVVPRNHYFSKRLLRNLTEVHLYLMDSRNFLRELSQRADITEGTTFFYLDAHWYEDLPLEEELDLIAPTWEDYVILIDDFQVAGDTGYGFDDYGAGKALTLGYLSAVVKKHRLSVYFPKAASDLETGKKRGYCVLASPASSPIISRCDLLRPA